MLDEQSLLHNFWRQLNKEDYYEDTQKKDGEYNYFRKDPTRFGNEEDTNSVDSD